MSDEPDLELREMLKAQALGQPEWGRYGSSREHRRYAMPTKGLRRKCGCGRRRTHLGCANGVALMSGCEFYVRRWVRDPAARRCTAADSSVVQGGDQQ